MLKSRVRNLEKYAIKEALKSQGDDIYNQDVIIIKSFKDFMQVYSEEPPFIKPTARILWTKQMRHWVDHYFDDDGVDIVCRNPPLETESNTDDGEQVTPPLMTQRVPQGGQGGLEQEPANKNEANNKEEFENNDNEESEPGPYGSFD